MSSLQIELKTKKREKNVKKSTVAWKWHFRVRRLDFSLSFRQIRPSEVCGARRKAALPREVYAWTPDLRSFEKLRKVGVSPYLGFILYLSTLQCFDLFEALNGCLIGPKTWDRSVRILWNLKWTVRAVHGLFGVIYGENCAMNDALIGMRPEMAMKFGFTK